MSLEDDIDDQNPFYKGSTQGNEDEFDILDPYSNVIFFLSNYYLSYINLGIQGFNKQ